MMENYFKIMKVSSNKKFYEQLAKWLSRNYLKKYMKILELGNGEGILTDSIKNLGYNIEGHDLEVDLENKLPFKKQTFDCIIMKSVIEHVRNIMPLTSELYRILNKNGIVIIMTNNTPVDFNGFLEDPTHVTPFSIKRLKNLFLMNNFKVIQLRKWRNIPYLWRYSYRSFDYAFPFAHEIFGVFMKK